MNRTLLPFWLTLTIVSVPIGPTASHAMSTSTAKQQIEQTLRQRTSAHNRKDLDGYLKTFSKAYVAENVIGAKTAYPRLRSSMIYNFAHDVMGTTQYRITGVRVSGNTARITVLALYTYPPSVQAKARAHVYKRTISDQIWVHTAHGWQEQHEQYLMDENIFSKKPLTIDQAI